MSVTYPMSLDDANVAPDEDQSKAPPGYVYAPYAKRAGRIVSAYWSDRYEREAARNWDQFYRRHEDRFFKDRHYLAAEWPELASDRPSAAAAAATNDEGRADVGGVVDQEADTGGAEVQQTMAELMDGTAADGELVMLEAGCGVGNTLFPLLRAHPRLRVFGCDFAEAAIDIVRRHPLHKAGRVTVAVGDEREWRPNPRPS